MFENKNVFWKRKKRNRNKKGNKVMTADIEYCSTFVLFELSERNMEHIGKKTADKNVNGTLFPKIIKYCPKLTSALMWSDKMNAIECL